MLLCLQRPRLAKSNQCKLLIVHWALKIEGRIRRCFPIGWCQLRRTREGSGCLAGPGARSLLETGAKGKASRAAGVVGGEPEAFGLFYLVEILVIHSFDVEVPHDQMPAIAVAKGYRL